MWREVWISITLLTVEIAALYLVLTSERLGTKRRLLISLGICLAGLTLDKRWGSTHQSGAAYTNGYFLLLAVIALLVAAGRTARKTSPH